MSGQARALARASLSAAAGVAALYIGSLLPGGRIAILCIASLGVVFVKMSCSGLWALGCFAVTSVLSMLILPQKSLALLYAFFVGYYPLVKLRAERFSSLTGRWGLKIGCFAAAFALLLILAKSFGLLADVIGSLALWLVIPAGFAAFWLYDYALGQLILYYLRNLAGRIK